MLTIKTADSRLIFDPAARALTSLSRGGREYICGNVPVFEISLLDREGNRTRLTAADAAAVTPTEDGAVFSGFPLELTVRVRFSSDFPVRAWISVQNGTDDLCEWVDFPRLTLPRLKRNGGDGEILLPYNEGMLIDDMYYKDHGPSPCMDPVYPSSARYCVFPNMLCSQFICRVGETDGVYLGLHDPARGVKQIDCYAQNVDAPWDSDIVMVQKTFCGGDFGEDYARAFPAVIDFFDGGWESGAAVYRDWFESCLPSGVTKTAETEGLPDWYADSPLIVTYPVRGIHDMDEMTPNALFPYTNALLHLRRIADATGCRIMALLMHWEGTAPWAPPYVWPPFGGEALFNEFRDALHEEGHLLGVYCSGFGYTKRSNLLPYSLEEEFEREGLVDAMTAGPDGRVTICRTCTGQRSGYDVCVANGKAKRLLDKAYSPLFAGGVDYAQILDQNHGGSQYLCYARNHDHKPCPGDWMTSRMQELLQGWNAKAGKMLLGCESAAAEPFIGSLRFSDNRFELNWAFGRPVPLYAFLYHEYLRNFMGNQCCAELDSRVDTMRMRLAYSFTAGDALTLVLTPEGKLMCNWGTRDFDSHPDMDKTLDFIASLERLSASGARRFLIDGKMLPAHPYDCTATDYPTSVGTKTRVPDVMSSAWEKDGERVQLFINHTDVPVTVTLSGETFTVPARGGVMRPY